MHYPKGESHMHYPKGESHMHYPSRTTLIKLASKLPAGSKQRKAVLKQIKVGYKGSNLNTPFLKLIGKALKSLLRNFLTSGSSFGLEVRGSTLAVYVYQAQVWDDYYEATFDDMGNVLPGVDEFRQAKRIFEPVEKALADKLTKFFGVAPSDTEAYDGGGSGLPFHRFDFAISKIFSS